MNIRNEYSVRCCHMKKTWFTLAVSSFLILAVLLSISGCSSKASPDKVTKDFLDAMIKGEFETASKLAGRANIEKEILGIAEDEQHEHFFQLALSRVTYKVDSKKVEGDNAEVNVKVTALDVLRIAIRTINELSTIGFVMALSEEQSQENISALFQQYFENAMSDPSAPMVVSDIQIKLEKKEGSWTVLPDDALVNAITSNLPEAFAWLEESTSLPKRGIRLVLEAQGVEEMTVKQRDDTLNLVVAILRNRVDQYGLTNTEIKRIETDRILVNCPETKNLTEVRALIGQTAMLQFHKVVEAGTSPNSDLVPSSSAQEVLYNRDGIPYIIETEPLLTGAALSDALVRTSQSMQNAGSLYIAMTFNQEGAQQFVEALRKLKGDNPDTPQNEGDLLAIVLDNVIYSAPRITQSIKDAAAKGWRNVQSTTTISGKFTKEEATRIAIELRTGALPVAIKVVEEKRGW